MKVKKSEGWITLEISQYEAKILASQSEDLQKMASGEIQGITTGGANIRIELGED